MLAIVIPYYKRQYFLECIESLANQTNKNFRVYIGDDASPQDPLDIVERFSVSLDIIYHRFHENLGSISLTQQWHRCIDLSQGERWLMILGDDDYLSENYVSEFYNNLEEIECLDIKVVRFASRIVRSPAGVISELYTHPKIERSTDFVYRRYFEGSRGSLTEQIFRRDAFLKYGFSHIPLGWGADLFAWMQMSEFGMNFAINNATAYFRVSDYNISRGGFKEEIKLNARIEFFSKYVLPNLKEFKQQQQIMFIKLYQQILIKAKEINFHNWFKISLLFLGNKNFIFFMNFNRTYLIHVFKTLSPYSILNYFKEIITGIKFQIYHANRALIRFVETRKKTEFERRVWKRQNILFGSCYNKELSNFKFYQSDSFEVWKNSFGWQRRLENKLNAKEFARKSSVKVAKKIWNGRKEDFDMLDLNSLPKNITIKPIRGEASKNVFLMKDDFNLFDKLKYSKEELRTAINEMYLNKSVSEILIEEFLPNEEGEIKVPNDYRFYTFNGEILFIQLDKREAFNKDQVSFYDPDWNLIANRILVDAVTDKYESPPNCFLEMKLEAQKLSRHYKIFSRIDFYATINGAVFGEFTPTPRKGKFLTKFGNQELINAWDKHCKGMI